MNPLPRNPELSPAELDHAVGNAIAARATAMKAAGPEDAGYRGIATAVHLAVQQAVADAAWGRTSSRRLDQAEAAIIRQALDAALDTIAASATRQG